MRRFAPQISLVAVLVLAIPLLGATDGDTDEATVETPTAAPQKMRRVKAPVRGGAAREDAALWWDDPEIVKALSLSDEQRKKMNEVLAKYRANVPRNPKPEAFHETLVQGDWKAARKEGDKVAEVAAESVRMRGALKIDVLSLLTKEQLGILVDRYPRLIYTPWRRAMRATPDP